MITEHKACTNEQRLTALDEPLTHSRTVLNCNGFNFVELDFHQYIYSKEKIVLKVARVITLDLRES